MKNLFTKINNSRLQTSHTGKLNNMYFSLNDRIKVFSENNNHYNFEKEVIIDEEILNFHVFGENLLLIGRNSKKLFLYNQDGNKLKE